VKERTGSTKKEFFHREHRGRGEGIKSGKKAFLDEEAIL
jgi:hypothetical protein